MEHANAIPKQTDSSKEGVRERTTLDHIIERLASMELPGKEYLEQYILHKISVPAVIISEMVLTSHGFLFKECPLLPFQKHGYNNSGNSSLIFIDTEGSLLD